MNIPDEVLRRAGDATESLDPPYTEDVDAAICAAAPVIAEWARKEALREAAATIAAEEGPSQDFWGMERAEEIIRALAEGDN